MVQRELEEVTMKIYLAGPLFTTAEILFNAELARGLRAAGHEVLLPQEKQDGGTTVLFRNCLEGISWCDVVVACMDGPDPDSGTCAEVGHAYGLRPIVAYRTDFRAGGDGASEGYNLVLAGMATVNLGLDSMHLAVATSMICEALERPAVRDFKTKTASAAGDVEGLAKLVAPILRELLDRASPDVPVAAIEIARAAIAHVGMGVEAVFRQRISELADQVDVMEKLLDERGGREVEVKLRPCTNSQCDGCGGYDCSTCNGLGFCPRCHGNGHEPTPPSDGALGGRQCPTPR